MNEERIVWGKFDTEDEKMELISKYDPEKIEEYELTKQEKFIHPTGSTYEGEWSPIDMEGIGTYILPHGVIYEGQMKDGSYHGKGVLKYPTGKKIVGECHEGDLISWKIKDGDTDIIPLKTYCKQPDRRFFTTHQDKLQPPGSEYLTNLQPTRSIPKGCYDVGDGFFDPRTLWVHSSEDMKKFLYNPTIKDAKSKTNLFKSDPNEFISLIPNVPVYKSSEWIKENCRKAWDEATGYKPKHYEYWFAGRKKEKEHLNKLVEENKSEFPQEDSSCFKIIKEFMKKAETKKKEIEKKIEDETANSEKATTPSENIDNKKYMSRHPHNVAFDSKNN